MIVWLMLLGIAICLTTFFIGLTIYSGWQQQNIKGLVLISLIGLLAVIICYYFFNQAIQQPKL